VGALAPESEEGEDRPGGVGGEARSARGRSPLSRERVPAAEGRGARARESRRGGAGRERGTSITPRRKPADARDGAAKCNAAQPSAPAAPPPRILQCRVDALHVRFRGRLDPKVREAFVDALATVKDVGGSNIAVSVGAYDFALSARSREGRWNLERLDCAATMDEGSQVDGWGLTIQLRAMTLAVLGPAACATLAADIATSILHVVEGERVAWVDLCADLVGFDVDAIVAGQLVGSGRMRAEKFTPSAEECSREWFLGGERTAFYAGRGDLLLRIYDKTVHLQNDVVGDRRSAEHARWKTNGWNGIDRVTRVEFQVRGAALKEMDGGQLRDTGRFVQRLDALWKYLTCKWVRLCVLASASRRARWTTDPRWALVQEAQFFESTGEVAERKRVRGAPRVEYAASIALSYAAKSSLLDDIAIPTLQQMARWTVTEAREFVLTKLGAILGAVGDDLARKLLVQRGPVRSASFVAERLRAATARAASTVPLSAFSTQEAAAE
jgi:hypothetical protein